MDLETRPSEKFFQFSSEAFNKISMQYGSGWLVVTALNAKTLHLRYSSNGQFQTRRAWAVARDDKEYVGVPLLITERVETLELATDSLRLEVRYRDGGIKLFTQDGQLLVEDLPEQGPLWHEDGSIINNKVLPPDEYYYGFGERTGLLEKRGRRYTCWNTDPGDSNRDHGPGGDQLHQSIPFYMALRPQKGGYGLFFNNTFKTVFDVGHTDPNLLSLKATGGELDYYLFYGPEPATIVEAYTALTGRLNLPPLWSLGYHQSRWGYYPENKVREIVDNFRERNIPLDAIHLDIDYMDGYRVFTWDKNRFPEPENLIQYVGDQGVKVVAIIDPGVKYDPGNYPVYDEGLQNDYFIREADGEVAHGYVWPGDSVFPDFARPQVRQWWGDLHQSLLALGIKGIWNDMNEPAIVSAPFGMSGKIIDLPDDTPHGGNDGEELITHAEVHNVYALLENIATYEGLRKLQPDARPFILTRAGYAGIQKWAAVWTGDNTALWEHLEMAMPQLSNLGLSGVSFAGTDIGGFYWHSSSELWTRWIELGAFYPFSRGHSVTTARQKEPWVWGDQAEDIARKYLELRYRFLPYMYTLFEESTRNGVPILRPLVYEFYNDPRVMELYDQVILGSALLIAPIYRPGVLHRHVYLPAGGWYDFWDGQFIDERDLLARAPLDVLPLYVRAGTILTLGPVMQYSDQRPLDHLTLEIYLDANGQAGGHLYEDDGISFAYQQGQSAYTTYLVTTAKTGLVNITSRRQGSYNPPQRPVEIRLHGLTRLKTYLLEEDTGNWEISI